MRRFPTILSENSLQLENTELNSAGQAAFNSLRERGYSVHIGLTESDALQLKKIAHQPSIRNYCPKDYSERFKDIESTKHWMSKGRIIFVLKHDESGEIAGYGWSRPGLNEHIPDGTLTGALRISELHQGRGLATPFLAVTLDYTQRNWPTDVLWYESWQSNAGAIHIYENLGFKLIEAVPSTRQTDTGETVEDVRLYMRLRSGQS